MIQISVEAAGNDPTRPPDPSSGALRVEASGVRAGSGPTERTLDAVR